MRYAFSFLCIASAVTLVACSKSHGTTTPPTAAAANCGGDPYLMKYQCSVDRVQAAAENGDADAEYALGYMYYYGVNTPRDQDSAKLWISRSAAQGQPLAKSALAMITQGGTVTSTQHQASAVHQQTTTLAKNETSTNTLKSASAQVTYQKPITSLAANQIHPVANPVVKHIDEDDTKSVSMASVDVPHHAGLHAVEDNDVAQMEGELMHTANQGYTLQLMGNHNEAVVKDFVQRHHLVGKAAYYYSSLDHENWYMVVYGQYQTVSQASHAIAELPADLRKMQPWIKPNKDVKEEIQTRHLIS